MPTIRIEGIAEIKKRLAKNIKMDDVKRVVSKNGERLQAAAQKNAEFKGHWGWKPGVGRTFIKPTGKLKGSIGLEITNGGLSAEVEPTAEYAPYVEFGTRYMAAQPYLKPAFEKQYEQFKSDMQKLVK